MNELFIKLITTKIKLDKQNFSTNKKSSKNGREETELTETKTDFLKSFLRDETKFKKQNEKQNLLISPEKLIGTFLRQFHKVQWTAVLESLDNENFRVDNKVALELLLRLLAAMPPGCSDVFNRLLYGEIWGNFLSHYELLKVFFGLLLNK